MDLTIKRSLQSGPVEVQITHITKIPRIRISHWEIDIEGTTSGPQIEIIEGARPVGEKSSEAPENGGERESCRKRPWKRWKSRGQTRTTK